ncbi:hypothetical protein GX586_12365 [bacterium]|nr:hypothetical protein [bacterium]
MDATVLSKDDCAYPERLTACLGQDAPEALRFAGDCSLLARRTLALFCSVQCTGAMIMHTYEFVKRLRMFDLAIISGFHSPMEKECLRSLAGGSAGIVACLAKALESYTIAGDLEKPFDQGRALVLSPFAPSVRRIEDKTARYRNLVAAALADEVFVSYAAPGSHTESFCTQILAWEKPVLTLDTPENAGIVGLGAQAVQPRDIHSLWHEHQPGAMELEAAVDR